MRTIEINPDDISSKNHTTEEVKQLINHYWMERVR